MVKVSFAFFVAHGLPEPVTELKFHPLRKWRFDYAWPLQMVALEVEGGVFAGGRHTRGRGFVADMEKYNAAAVLGWKLIRCTPQQLSRGEVMATIRAAMEGQP